MTKLTTERLEYYAELPTKPAERKAIFMYEVRCMARQLLAYEQAAKNPIAWVVGDEEIADFKNGREVCVMRDCDDEQLDYLPLYAAPVLPKQPECSRQHFESLCNQFWNWAEFDEINHDEEPRLEWNGSNYKHRVTAALWKMYQAAPAQPVIPGQLTSRMAEAKALSLGAVLNDEEADIYADGWNCCRAEMLKAQRVSEPYKLDGVWISVNDRLPENKSGSYEYLVFDELNNKVNHDYWNVPDGIGDDFKPFWNHYGSYVTHWMPLPAAPAQESE